MELKFTLKDTKEKLTLLYAVCYFQSKRIKVSTGQKVVTETWNVKMQRCEVGNKFPDRINRVSRKVNKFLDRVMKQWEEWGLVNYDNPNPYHYKKWNNGEDDAKLIKKKVYNIIFNGTIDEVKEQKKEQITPLQFFNKYVEGMTHMVDQRTGRYIGERTQIHHRTVLKRIKAFMAEKYIKDDFSVFDERFARLFTDWAYTSKNYRQNTIPATFSVLKVWLNAAKAEKLFDSDEYKKYPSKGADVDNIYLTKDEIERIYRLDIPALKAKGEIDAKSQMEVTRDLFIIGCWTGLRRNDLNRLEKALFDMDKEEITIVTEKTGEKVTIPMHPFIKELYTKYEGKFPKLADKSNTSRHLQEIGRHAKIEDEVMIKENRGGKIFSHIYKKYQMIRMHTARRSFATNLYLDGAKTISIMKLTGHTTEMNFLKYIKVTREENAEDTRRFFK